MLAQTRGCNREGQLKECRSSVVEAEPGRTRQPTPGASSPWFQAPTNQIETETAATADRVRPREQRLTAGHRAHWSTTWQRAVPTASPPSCSPNGLIISKRTSLTPVRKKARNISSCDWEYWTAGRKRLTLSEHIAQSGERRADPDRTGSSSLKARSPQYLGAILRLADGFN